MEGVYGAKVMRSGKSGGEIVKTGRWPCAVCGKDVGANSIQCTDCCGWVHKRCSGARCPDGQMPGLVRNDAKDGVKWRALSWE